MKSFGIGAGAALLAAWAMAALPEEDARAGAQPAPNDAPHAAARHDAAERPTKAVAVLFPVGDSGVSGVLTIEQQGRDRVSIGGTVRGLEPNSRHGFHIHEFGDLRDLEKGRSVGDHFAPHGSPHGRPDAPAEERHVGDLGNIEANDEGVAEVRIEDELVRLHGPNSVIGRAFVVHAKEDKFTQPSGDAGDRIAFGTIGIAKPDG
ncbi:MAG TPA: superoxide dismutase family protein [Planctomycetaceae bacterium]